MCTSVGLDGWMHTIVLYGLLAVVCSRFLVQCGSRTAADAVDLASEKARFQAMATCSLLPRLQTCRFRTMNDNEALKHETVSCSRSKVKGKRAWRRNTFEVIQPAWYEKTKNQMIVDCAFRQTSAPVEHVRNSVSGALPAWRCRGDRMRRRIPRV